MLVVHYSDVDDYLKDMLLVDEVTGALHVYLTTVFKMPTNDDPVPRAWVEVGYLLEECIFRLVVPLGVVLLNHLSEEQRARRDQVYDAIKRRVQEMQDVLARGRLRWAVEMPRAT